MPEVGLQIAFLLVLIAINGVLAMSEMAVVSARKVRLQQQAERGNAGAQAALALAREPSRFLSTVQVGITSVGVVAGAFGGETLSLELADFFRTNPSLAPFAHQLGFALVVLAITYASLVLGELFPKRIALVHAERIAALLARPMGFVSTATSPVVWFLTASTNALLRLTRQKTPDDEPMSDEEMKIIVQQATEAGTFDPAQQDLLEAALRLADRSVENLMTPRPLVDWLNLLDPTHDNLRKIAASPHLAFPVADGSLDEVVGVTSAKHLFSHLVEGRPIDLRDTAAPAIFVSEHLPALKLLDVFKQPGPEMVVVLEERGGVTGIVTLADLLGAITGDALPLGRRGDQRPEELADGSWILDGLLGIDELKAVLDVEEVPGEDRQRYQSLGGFVLSQVGHVPQVGESFSWRDWEFEVVAMQARRIEKVLVKRG